jgi:DNA mismatch repair protein MutS
VASAPAPTPSAKAPSAPLPEPEPAAAEVLDRLRELDPNAMTPLEALTLLAELKARITS